MKAREDVVNWILKLAVGSLACMVLANGYCSASWIIHA